MDHELLDLRIGSPAGELEERRQLLERHIGLERVEPVDERVEVEIRIRVDQAPDELHDHLLLTAHAAVVLVDARADVAEGLGRVEGVRARFEVEIDDRVDQRRLEGDLHAVDGLDEWRRSRPCPTATWPSIYAVERLHRADQGVIPCPGTAR